MYGNVHLGEGTPSKDAEGWLPDNCQADTFESLGTGDLVDGRSLPGLSDHPRNLATKQSWNPMLEFVL